jgi:ryanodine receptor 2
VTYEPKPLDTTAVVLPPDVVALTEQLAENAHEVWAVTRIKQGWTFGPVRDDANKKHPCLVPYADLPDSEKVYDRGTAMETLKAVLALGYVVSKPA